MTRAKGHRGRTVGALLVALALVAAIALGACGGEAGAGDQQGGRSGEFKMNSGDGTYGIGF